MKALFNRVMRLVSTAIGMLLAALGAIWILQGLGIAFQDSFMAGDLQWTIYGAGLAIVGTAQAVWSNIRQD